jgi:GntR family transcriptional regulator, vanillate catabolism transcriptional regulator
MQFGLAAVCFSRMSAHADLPDSHQARVLVQLRDLILKGDFAPGERLAEIPLAARLGVSRTPVRLALATLEREGLVAPSASGYSMRRFTPKEIQDAIDVRGHLEGMAARLLAEQGAPRPLLLSLRERVADGDALFTNDGHDLDYAAYTDMNDRFHDLIVQGCGNAALARAIEINNRLPFAPASAMLPMQSSLEEGHRWMLFAHMQHRSLLHAIEHGEGARAQAIAQEHVQVAKLNLEYALDRPELAQRLLPGLKLVSSQDTK